MQAPSPIARPAPAAPDDGAPQDAAQGTLPIGDTSEHFGTTIANDIRSYAALIKSAGITAE